MGGSPHLTERQHAQHAPFPSPHRNSQYPVSATRGSGLVDSQQLPGTDRHASRRPAPAAQRTASPRADTGPSDLPYKLKSRTDSLGSSRDLDSRSQIQELPGSSNSTIHSDYSPKRSQAQSQPRARDLPAIDSHETQPYESSLDNGSQPSKILKSSPKMLLGQKRTAVGVGKSADSPQDSYGISKAGSERRRSGSIGSLSHGNRIAAVSDTASA